MFWKELFTLLDAWEAQITVQLERSVYSIKCNSKAIVKKFNIFTQGIPVTDIFVTIPPKQLSDAKQTRPFI